MTSKSSKNALIKKSLDKSDEGSVPVTDNNAEHLPVIESDSELEKMSFDQVLRSKYAESIFEKWELDIDEELKNGKTTLIPS